MKPHLSYRDSLPHQALTAWRFAPQEARSSRRKEAHFKSVTNSQSLSMNGFVSRCSPKGIQFRKKPQLGSLSEFIGRMPLRFGARILLTSAVPIMLIALAVLAFVWPAARATAAQTIAVVVPNGFANQMGGSGDRFPFSTTNRLRYQQVYDASQFSAISPYGGWIMAIRFRTGARPELYHKFRGNMPSLQVNLSTTTKGPDQLSLLFAENVGPDECIVFGPAPLDMTTPGYGVASYWDPPTAVPLTTPFFYNPVRGNLLMDVFNHQGSVTEGGHLDAANQNGDSVSQSYGNIGTRNPVQWTTGLITRFDIIPAPSPPTLAVAVFGQETVLRWPTNAADFVLESSGALLASSQWATVTNAPSIVGTNKVVTDTLAEISQFYRLRFVLTP